MVTENITHIPFQPQELEYLTDKKEQRICNFIREVIDFKCELEKDPKWKEKLNFSDEISEKPKEIKIPKRIKDISNVGKATLHEFVDRKINKINDEVEIALDNCTEEYKSDYMAFLKDVFYGFEEWLAVTDEQDEILNTITWEILWEKYHYQVYINPPSIGSILSKMNGLVRKPPKHIDDIDSDKDK